MFLHYWISLSPVFGEICLKNHCISRPDFNRRGCIKISAFTGSMHHITREHLSLCLCLSAKHVQMSVVGRGRVRADCLSRWQHSLSQIKKVRNAQTGRQNSLGDLPKKSLCMRETDVSIKRIGQNLFSCRALEEDWYHFHVCMVNTVRSHSQGGHELAWLYPR